VNDALDRLPLPVFAIAKNGVVRWLNQAAEAIFGDARGRRFVRMVAPESQGLVKQAFARKILGGAESTDYNAVLLRADGSRVDVEICSVPLSDADGEITGVFGAATLKTNADAAVRFAPDLTPRQAQVLTYLARGYSTDQMAEVMNVSSETVRNHVRGLLQRLGVHSRLEAVTAARVRGLISTD
jgi:PAS domain S-box-containing protein